MRRVWILFTACCLLGGCWPETEGRPVPALRIVHVAWPGRPVSDAVDREVFEDPRVRAVVARVPFVRTTVDRAPVGVRAVLRGTGTVVFEGDDPIAVRSGAMSARAWLAFVRRARAAAAALREGSRLERAALRVELGMAGRALEELGADGSAAAREIRIDANLALGDVAAARQLLESGGGVGRPGELEARVLVAERRPSAAIELLRGLEGSDLDGARAYWLGRALLDVDDRPAAYAQLEPLVSKTGRWAEAARELLDGAIFGGHGHSHR